MRYIKNFYHGTGKNRRKTWFSFIHIYDTWFSWGWSKRKGNLCFFSTYLKFLSYWICKIKFFWFFNGKIFLLKREMSSKPSKCLLTRDIYSYLEVKYNLVFIWQNKSPSATTLVCSLIFSKEKEINGFQSKCSLGFLIVFELFPIKK